MQYVSTRGGSEKLRAAQAIIRGIAGNRGLFVPEMFPSLPENFTDWTVLPYQEVAVRVLQPFLDDYPAEVLGQCVKSAYDDKFAAAEVAPLIKAGDTCFLELYHGRTAAFKDMALSLLPHLLTAALKQEDEQQQIAILTATSGDTGKAALEGFADVPGTQIVVLYPHVGVSQVQERQMTTQEGTNTHVFGIRGNFDDAQRAVKKLFNDESVAQKLGISGIRFSSANSINIGRLVPQVAYYVWAYLQMLKQEILKPGEAMNVVVPTGNFGNILAAWYAREMGLPVNRLICASNRNNVLTDFITTGTYDVRRNFHITTSPSMDILVSSNLERLLYHLSGGDSDQIKGFMQALETEGRYTVSSRIRKGLEGFYAGYADEAETREAIASLYQKHQYLMDPHTAVAHKVYRDFLQETGDTTPAVIAATASAYKFADTVTEALWGTPLGDGFAAVKELHQKTGVPIPVGLKGLEEKPVRHKTTLDQSGIETAVLDALKGS
ncbi:threonine synthase [Anoxynatronum sibiricum]|uniref:Threonine synthase n=1 Tax=Anoxynatronum sibiricum TaxID=210623 RepID=A0ABU9VP36_9CLOT